MAHWHDVLEEVIRERGPALVAYARLFVLDPRAAEDLVQQALVKVFGRVRPITNVHTGEAYVRRTIRTTFLDQHRRTKAYAARTHLLVEETTVRGPEQAVTARIDVTQALAGLSPRERACIILRHFEDLAVDDIAVELGLSAGSVKAYLRDGTAKLRAVLGDGVRTEPVDTPLSVPVIHERSAT